MNHINVYQTWLFDCDGVLLDSNKIKSDAFFEIAGEYGPGVAKDFLQYHQKNGGISRIKKFEYLFTQLLRMHPASIVAPMEKALLSFETLVKEKLMTCALTPQLEGLMKSISPQAKKYVVSGGLESELRDIFGRRKLDYFDGIFGGPRTKYQIIDDLMKSDPNLLKHAVFIGDSELDYQVADFYHIDFIFMNQFSEFKNWPAFFQDKAGVRVIENLQSLIP